MVGNKKSFILYCDLIHVVNKLVERDRENKTNYAGELFLHILKYVNNENPIPVDFIVEMAFEPIKSQLKRDLEKWSISKDSRSKNGVIGNLKRWHTDLYKKYNEKKITLEEAQEIAKHRKTSHSDKPDSTQSQKVANIAVNDSVSVNVNDTVNVSDIKEKKKKEKPLTPKGEQIDFKELINFFNETFDKKSRIINETIKKKYRARIKEGFKKTDIMNAMINASKDDFHKENGYKHCTLEFFSRSDKIDKFINIKEPIKTQKQNSRTQHMHVEKKRTKKDWVDVDAL